MTPLQIARHNEQREAHARREGERRRNALDTALATLQFERREADRREAIARRTADRIEAARFNHALARWHDAKEVA